jgi:hypothetical protein
VIQVTIAAEGSTGNSCIELVLPLLLFSDVHPVTDFRRLIEVVNKSHLQVKMQWKKSGISYKLIFPENEY